MRASSGTLPPRRHQNAPAFAGRERTAQKAQPTPFFVHGEHLLPSTARRAATAAFRAHQAPSVSNLAAARASLVPGAPCRRWRVPAHVMPARRGGSALLRAPRACGRRLKVARLALPAPIPALLTTARASHARLAPPIRFPAVAAARHAKRAVLVTPRRRAPSLATDAQTDSLRVRRAPLPVPSADQDTGALRRLRCRVARTSTTTTTPRPINEIASCAHLSQAREAWRTPPRLTRACAIRITTTALRSALLRYACRAVLA